jgi:hypothetical protein
MGEAADILDPYHLKKLRAKLDEILIVGSTYPGGGGFFDELPSACPSIQALISDDRKHSTIKNR